MANRYQELARLFFENRLLFGDPADTGIVAVEIASATEVEVIKRLSGKLTRERRPIRLFVLVDDPNHLNGFRGEFEVRTLDGDFGFRHMVMLDSGDTLEALKRHLRHTTGQAPNAPAAPYLVLTDPVEQYLMLTGATFFMGLEFSDLVRLQLDIETYITPGFEFPSAAREGDRVIAISITDSGRSQLKARRLDGSASTSPTSRRKCAPA